MAKKIITISRAFGSGGLDIGKKLSEKLGIPCYDKELIALAAKESGYALDYIKENGEYGNNSLLYNIAISSFGVSSFSHNNISAPDKIYILQNNIIRDIADKGPCIILGRSADYILRERDDVLNVFVYASDMEYRKKLLEDNGTPATEKEIIKKDKTRATNYKRYTSKDWGKAENYHICLDSSVLGIDKCVDLILKAIEM
ncbi:MAG: cytidylate kinase-like family protein [Ruminococcaceae bacterium]|nr:cytidylate kinase-like family protein [Oscillospiraceae bacterium]